MEWAHAVSVAGYSPSFYCSHRIAGKVAQLVGGMSPPVSRIWVFRVLSTQTHPYKGDPAAFATKAPSGCGFAPAFAWQYEHNARVRLPGAPASTQLMDLNVSLDLDPGAPDPA